MKKLKDLNNPLHIFQGLLLIHCIFVITKFSLFVFNNFFLSLVLIKKLFASFLKFCLIWLPSIMGVEIMSNIEFNCMQSCFCKLNKVITHGFSLEERLKGHILEMHSSVLNDKNNNIMYIYNKVVLHSNCPRRSNVKGNTLAFSTLGASKLEIIQGSKWCKRLE